MNKKLKSEILKLGLRKEIGKWVRDGCKQKSVNNKKSSCEVCSSKEKLNLHHCYTVTSLFKKYLSNFSRDDFIDRQEFYSLYEKELSNPEYQLTLCSSCHRKLHDKFGYNLISEKQVIKQKEYILKMKGRY